MRSVVILISCFLLPGCAVVTVVDTAIDVTATAVGTTVDVAAGAVRAVAGSPDDDLDCEGDDKEKDACKEKAPK